MRISADQRDRIVDAVRRHMGAGAHVWLFGSRVDDSSKGGDIDLYIEPAICNADEIVEAKLRFLADMHKKLGDQKIDVVIRREEGGEVLPIHRVAKETGIKLS